MNWPESDTIIVAYRCGEIRPCDCPELGGKHIPCELCGAILAVLPETEDKSKLKDWHIICFKCVGKVVADGHELSFRGRYVTSTEAKAVLQ